MADDNSYKLGDKHYQRLKKSKNQEMKLTMENRQWKVNIQDFYLKISLLA